MKPIEIHIEGYKIVISEDKEEPTVTKDNEERIVYIPSPYPVYPTPNTPFPNDPWRPYVTWTCDDVFNTNTTDSPTPIRDMMVGRNDHDSQRYDKSL